MTHDAFEAPQQRMKMESVREASSLRCRSLAHWRMLIAAVGEEADLFWRGRARVRMWSGA